MASASDQAIFFFRWHAVSGFAAFLLNVGACHIVMFPAGGYFSVYAA